MSFERITHKRSLTRSQTAELADSLWREDDVKRHLLRAVSSFGLPELEPLAGEQLPVGALLPPALDHADLGVGGLAVELAFRDVEMAADRGVPGHHDLELRTIDRLNRC